MEPEGTQEVQVPETAPTVSPSPQKAGSSGNKILVVIIVAVLILLAGAVAYFLGSRSGKSDEAIPTPTPEEVLFTPTPTEEISPTPTATISGTLTPTITGTQTMTINSTAALDGWRASNGGGNTTWYIQAGRNATLFERGFVSFDISTIPIGKTIDQATLRMYQQEVVGTPYSSIGNLTVDHMDYGETLGNEDLSVVGMTTNIGTLTSNATLEWKELIVTNPLKADITAGRTRSQYRLKFSTESTGPDAWARFESGDNYMGTTNLPQLVIKYR